MTTLEDYQRSFVEALFALDGAPHLSALERERPQRFAVYRRMVRRRILELLEWSLPRSVAAFGAEPFSALAARWFASAPPRSPYLRDLVAEFAGWAEGDEAPAARPWALQLVRYEAALREVEWASEEVGVPAVPEPLSMERPLLLHPAHRRVSLDHAVHRIGLDDDGRLAFVDPVEAAPFELLVYRDPDTHAPRVLELDSFAAALLDRAPAIALVAAGRQAAEAAALPVDAAFVAKFSELLEDLSARGVVLGAASA